MMAYIKYILKLIIFVQLLACIFATSGNPDAEFIDFGSPSQASRDQRIIEAAIERGMDGEAVAELLRTRQPTVRTTTTPTGFTKTTTYKLEPDGSISSKSIMQKRNRYVYNAGSIPDDLKNSPTGTVTRTYTDSDGNKVSQTVTVNRDKMLPDADADWSKHFSLFPEGSPKFFSYPRTYAATNGERRFMYGNDKSTFPTAAGFDWPAPSPTWDDRETMDGEDGWEVIDNPEVTTKQTWRSQIRPWTSFQAQPTATATTTTTTTTPANRKPLPSLDDFLKSQYGAPSNRETTTSTTKYETTTTPETSSTTTPKFIKIEDLPIVEILHNGKPADSSIVKTLPDHLTPHTPTETVLSIEHKHPIETQEDQQDFIDSYTPKMETNIRSYSKTHIGPEKPRLKDLDPQMQDILKNAGIVPEIEGDSVTKTRTEADGRVITTTYKVNTVPSLPPVTYVPPQSHYMASRLPSYQPVVPLQPLMPHLSPIAEFLARFGLTKYYITSRNGHYAKSIIDENGDVLTATFVLTSISNKSSNGRK